MTVFHSCRCRFIQLLLCASIAGFYSVNAADIIVSMNGLSVSAAVKQAASYDRIIVRPGTHQAINVLIDKRLTIIGERGAILDGLGKSQILLIKADSVTLRGLEFRRSSVSYVDDNAAVKAMGISGLRVENCTFNENFFGVYLAKSTGCMVRNCTFKAMGTLESASGNGIHQWHCRNSLIENNVVDGHRDGIYLEFSRHAVIRGNSSKNNLRYGLHFMFSDSCAYRNNAFEQNGAGVAVMYSHVIEMTGNTFSRNWGSAAYGLLLKDITDGRIESNIFEQNTIGLYADGCNRNTVEHNTFTRNGWGVKIYANSLQNSFSGNNFLSNTFAVATNSSSQQSNTFEGNFWSDYSGYDLNRDGVGDVPHHPVRLFTLLIEQQPTSLILLRSLFIDLLDLAEKAMPALTPETLADKRPKMKPFP